MNVMIDLDGCLVDFVYGFTKKAKELGLCSNILNVHQQPSWDGFGGISEENTNKVWDVIVRSTNFWQKLPLISGVTCDTMRRLNDINENENVTFVTNRMGRFAKQQTVKWLLENDIDNPNVLLSKRKGDVARALDIQYSVEDKAENACCIHWIADSVPCKSYLINRLYNQSEFIPKNVIRVNSFDEFLDDIETKI